MGQNILIKVKQELQCKRQRLWFLKDTTMVVGVMQRVETQAIVQSLLGRVSSFMIPT
jgi:hypothetical protein